MFKFSHSAELYEGIEVTAEHTTTADDACDVVDTFENFLRGCGMLAESEHIEILSNIKSEPESEPESEPDSKSVSESYNAGYDQALSDLEEITRLAQEESFNTTEYLNGYTSALNDNT